MEDDQRQDGHDIGTRDEDLIGDGGIGELQAELDGIAQPALESTAAIVTSEAANSPYS